MRIAGFEISRAKAAVAPVADEGRVLLPPKAWGSTGIGVVREPFAGAWQAGMVAHTNETVLAFSAVYSCLTLISQDISKLRPMLVEKRPQGRWAEVENAAFSPVLRKPNKYQTRIQFYASWILSKLIHGNTVVLLDRDDRGIVVQMHVIPWRNVKMLVSDHGDVFYSIKSNKLADVGEVTVVASSIIHDRCADLFHTLVGVPPIFACALSASQATRAQVSASKFFENMSRPSGMLTTTETITDETAERLKTTFEANFSGQQIGRLLIAGDGLEFKPMTIPAEQAQLIEQLKWTVNDVAACFHTPAHKVGGDAAALKYSNMSEANEDYYASTLQAHIEAIEILLDEGLGLADGGPQRLGVAFDLEGLLRMDPVARANRNAAAIKAGYMAPNEARATENLPPVAGGDEPYLQQQNFPLSVLAKQPPPGATPAADAAKMMKAISAMETAAAALTKRAEVKT